MKRNIVYIVLSLAIAFSFCGCSDSALEEGSTVTNRPAVSNVPLVTPELDDGIVGDGDGVLDENDGADGGVTGTPGVSMGKNKDTESKGPQSSTAPTEKAGT